MLILQLSCFDGQGNYICVPLCQAMCQMQTAICRIKDTSPLTTGWLKRCLLGKEESKS